MFLKIKMKILEKEVEKGDSKFFKLPVSNTLEGSELTIPLHVVRGKEDGPVLGITASVHGQEYYHNRIIKQIIDEVNPSELSGTIMAIPVANPPAFSHNSRLTPYPPEETVDFANLNRVFPGRRITPLFGSMEHTDVSLTMKMASIITDNFVSKCTHLIDFHGHMDGGALKKMLYNRHDPKSNELVRVFGLGLIHDPITGGDKEPKSQYMPMTEYAGTLGIPAIVPEIGGGRHGECYEKICTNMGVQGIKNVMSHLKMAENEMVLPEKQFYFRKAPHVRATKAGYMVSNMEAEDVGIGQPTREVEKSEVLATIYDPYTLKELEQLKAPADGLLYMCLVSGLIEAQGYGIAVADFDGSKWIE
jgi:predicted deacylase